MKILGFILAIFFVLGISGLLINPVNSQQDDVVWDSRSCYFHIEKQITEETKT